MTVYLTNDSDLTSVANAIRTKSGTSNSLVYPTGFVTAINNISGDGGDEGMWQDLTDEFIAFDSGWSELYSFTVVANGSMVWMCAVDNGDMGILIPPEYTPIGEYTVASLVCVDPSNPCIPYCDGDVLNIGNTGQPFSIMWPYNAS